MPSDASEAALAALKEPREAFLSAVAATAEELRGYLSAHAAPGDDRAARVAQELGPFAGGRVDPDRFAAFLGQGEALDPGARRLLELAESVLDDAASWGQRSFLVKLQPGGDLRSGVGLALAWLGRVFGAAAAVERAKQGRSGSDESLLVDAFPFRRWTRAQRGLAPPLVVEMEGTDLVAGGLAAFLDGTQKLVLVVQGPVPPAPLARLVSPGVLVIQTDEVDGLKRLGGFDGPAVAALMPEGQGARFVHDPTLGATLADRLTVTALPRESEVQPLGSLTVWQQLQELRQLGALAELMERAGVAAAQAPPADETRGVGPRKLATVEPADTLAGWLLGQADLSDL